MEEAFRETERKQIETAVGLEKVGLDGGFIPKNAARTAAKADYHAAMKRKYEEAAARRMVLRRARPARAALALNDALTARFGRFRS